MRPLPTHLQSYQYVPELAFDMAEDDSPTGMVRAVVASLEVADSWGRIVHAGAVGSQEVIVSEWAHSAIWNDAPVGVGRVYEENNSLLAELQYDMEREAGKNAYTMVRGWESWRSGVLPTTRQRWKNATAKYIFGQLT